MGEYENKAEFIIKEGKIVEIKIKQVGNSKPLQPKDLRNFNQFLSRFGDKIVEKWIEYFNSKEKSFV